MQHPKSELPDLAFVVLDSLSLGQPYVINLFKRLEQSFGIEVFLDENNLSRARVIEASDRRVPANRSVRVLGLIYAMLLKCRLHAIARLLSCEYDFRNVPCRAIGRAAASLKVRKAREVVAVEYPAVLACQLARVKPHFVSLELLQHRPESLLVRLSDVKSCITQNWLRYLALFPSNPEVPCFLVPNFPNLLAPNIELTNTRAGCVLAGTAIPGFGLNAIVEYSRIYSERLTLLGWSPPDLQDRLRERGVTEEQISRISIVRDYLSDEAFIAQVARHEFGFSFYDLSNAHTTFHSDGRGLSPWSMQNYLTGFPGKIGMCMNAGVPIIVSDHPGTTFVEEHGVGVAISTVCPHKIHAASKTIRENIVNMRSNCLRLASLFAFNKNIEPFIDFLRASRG